MNIACAWELGTNLGHLTRLRAVAASLDAAGHKVNLLLADLSRVSMLFDASRVRLLQSPVYRQKLRLNRPVASLADVLTLYGYNTRESLEGLLLGWENLLRLSAADMLVADHAPTAQLAARRLGIPVVIIGNGFTAPQAGAPLMDWRPVPVQDNVVRDQERFVLAHVNALLPPAVRLACVSDLYQCNRILIDSFPLVDPQRALRRNARYCAGGPGAGTGSGDAWFVPGPRDKVGVYLHPSYGKVREVCEALSRLEAEIVVLCPEAPQDVLQNLRQVAGIRVITEFVNLEQMMQHCDWFVSHGGLGTATLCLRQGKPQVLLPTQMEQLNTAMQLQQAGLAHVIPLLESADAYEHAFSGCLPDARMRARAAAYPKENAACLQTTLAEALLESLELLSAPRVAPAAPPSHP